jgi:hypothetical protein
MNQFAPFVALIADDLRLWIKGGEATKSRPTQHKPYRRRRSAQPLGNGGAGQTLATERHDLALMLIDQPHRAAVRSGGAVQQASAALGSVGAAPFAHGFGADALGLRNGSHCPAAVQPLDHSHSTMAGWARIIMNVHSGPPGRGCVYGNHSLSARRDILYSSYI